MRPFVHLLLLLALAPLFTGCFSQDSIDRRVEKSKASYYERLDKRKIKAYQREARYDAWIDSVFD